MTDPVESIARAVLYEGYLLYPYRSSATKNQVRWTFGGLFPRAYADATGGSEPWRMRSDCLLLGGPACRVEVTVRFLRPLERTGTGLSPWHEAGEHSLALGSVELARLRSAPVEAGIELPGGREVEGGVSREWRPLSAFARVAAEPISGAADRISVTVENRTPLADAGALRRDQAALCCMASTHAVLRASGGVFASLADPPEELREAAASCRNEGTWPVLVGDPSNPDTVLASPIILEDFPTVAAESPGDLFDSTEIDELLTLRILTMSDAEKEEMRRGDERARRLLDRTEALTREELVRLHGALRSLRPVPNVAPSRPDLPAWDPWGQTRPIESVGWGDGRLNVGDPVRLRPRGGADIMDLALAGRTARVQAIEMDFDDVVHVAVVLDDDPGRDLGEQRQPGHRFFFRLSEIEAL